VREVFDEVRKKLPVGEELILSTGVKNLNDCMSDKISKHDLTHGSCIVSQ